MKISRLLLHPFIANYRSLSILLCNLLAVAISSAIFAFHYFSTVRRAGISLVYFPSQPNLLLSILLTPSTHFALAGAAVLIGAGIIVINIVGPVKRMEQWFQDWEAGLEMGPIEIRERDEAYKNINTMLNILRTKSSKHRPKK